MAGKATYSKILNSSGLPWREDRQNLECHLPRGVGVLKDFNLRKRCDNARYFRWATVLSRRDSTIVAWREMPGQGPPQKSRPVKYGLIRADVSTDSMIEVTKFRRRNRKHLCCMVFLARETPRHLVVWKSSKRSSSKNQGGSAWRLARSGNALTPASDGASPYRDNEAI
jgi:hypothetical protein